jgi:hypothetical protein
MAFLIRSDENEKNLKLFELAANTEAQSSC